MNSRHHRLTRRLVRLYLLTLLFALLIGLVPQAAEAHPLGNFTTNTAIRATVSAQKLKVLYVIDLAEIPTLKVRQELHAVSGVVPSSIAGTWAQKECGSARSRVSITDAGKLLTLSSDAAEASFANGQAGLTTMRIECTWSSPLDPATLTARTLRVADRNYADRVGWREITAIGDGTTLSGEIETASPTALLTRYDNRAVATPLRQTDASFSVILGGQASSDGPTVRGAAAINRGNDGLTERFQSLVARRELTWPFVIGAIMLALALGGLHALAPGHGKTIMAAYAVSRQGSRRDMLSIGGTVALTHTIGIVVLGSIVSATSIVSPDRALKWASVGSGVLVLAIGIGLVRGRTRAALRRRTTSHADHPHTHDHDDHHHDRDHDHLHDHDHHDHHDHDHHDHGEHAHPHHDERFVVTSHRHGGWSHDHILPAPGANVRRRELITMGLAGGLAPSPSALVVLLAAIALGRLELGLALVVAYGVGLAATLVGVGLALVRLESRARRWTANRDSAMGVRIGNALAMMPIVSGMAIVGAGFLLVLRSLSSL